MRSTFLWETCSQSPRCNRLISICIPTIIALIPHCAFVQQLWNGIVIAHTVLIVEIIWLCRHPFHRVRTAGSRLYYYPSLHFWRFFCLSRKLSPLLSLIDEHFSHLLINDVFDIYSNEEGFMLLFYLVDLLLYGFVLLNLHDIVLY